MSSEFENVVWPGWEVVRLIGRGSSGAVYEIQRDVFGHKEQAALKVITLPQNGSDIEDLYNDGYDEASVTARFEGYLKDIVQEYSFMSEMKGHTNIVYCDDLRYVQHDDRVGWDIYIKMEYLTPLPRALQGSISEEACIRVGIDICNALALCKSRNLIHRDIKPQNIFVSQDGNYKLGDFGIAKTTERTTMGAKVGTYKYMAPEVYNNQPYGRSADIYSLGLVMYWMLNERRTPFLPMPPQIPTGSMEDVARNRRFGGEPLPEPKNGSVGLKAVVLKACAYNPKERYHDPEDMRADLEAVMAGGLPAFMLAPAGDKPVELEKPEPKEPEPDLPPDIYYPGEKKEPVGTPVPPMNEPEFEDNDGKTNIPIPIPRRKNEEKVPPIAPEKKKKKGIWKWVAAAAAVILILLLLPQTCYGNLFSDSDDSSKAASASTATAKAEKTAVPTATPVKQLEWTDWMEALPKGVSENEYEIEETTLYSSRNKETTSSTSRNMDGWTQYDTASAGKDYGAWSEWSTDSVAGSSSREVESRKEYRYQDLEYTTGSSSSKSGWELYNTTYSYGDYGSWSGWSTTAVSSSDNTQVETKKEYRYQYLEYTTSTSSSLSGWTLYSGPNYGDWGSSQTTSTKPTESDTLRITATKQTKWGYYHVCCNYYDGGYNVDSISYGSGAHNKHYTSSTWAYPACSIGDKGGKQAYGGTGSGCAGCGSGFYIWFRNTGGDEYQYTYQTRSVYYTFYKWGSYSSWGSSYPGDADSVESRTLYRSRTRQSIPTYHFKRWGSLTDWSTTQASSSDTRKVQERTVYRYRDIVNKKTYLFYRWTDWSEYGVTPVTEDDSTEVQTKKMYRYRSKTNN